ncbi:MAG: ABC transporter ATP-binding protein [bacterium]|nr:ABC transporter ATP-binding protein [bacterium]
MHNSFSSGSNSLLLTVGNVKASYYKKEILHGVSLELRKGEIASLIGPNGAGKSTLLKVIFGLLKPTEGKVIFQGEDIAGHSPYLNVKQGIGYFIQGGEVFTDLSIAENLELSYYQREKAPFKERKDEVLELFPALKKETTKRAGLLSGGERQMLALGMLLIKRPRLLLLDEPSAGLAPAIVKSLIDSIKEIRDKFSTSILLVKQNIREALRISDRCYLLRAGKIEVEDTPENILENGELEKAFFA